MIVFISQMGMKADKNLEREVRSGCAVFTYHDQLHPPGFAARFALSDE